MQAPSEGISSYSFFTSAVGGVSGQRNTPVPLCPREKTLCTHWVGGWVGLRAALDTEAVEKILSFCRGVYNDVVFKEIVLT
jgi:hypothetical protein